MYDNKPLKGFHGIVNLDVIDFIDTALTEITAVWDDDCVAENPDAVLKRLMDEYGWVHENDKFANKVYKATAYPASTPPLPSDQFRVTLLNPKGTRNGALYLDMRAWGQYSNGN